MKLTEKECQDCRIDASVDEPPEYEVVVIPGWGQPAWEECDPYDIYGAQGYPIRAEIRVTVGSQYIEQLRVHTARTAKEEAR